MRFRLGFASGFVTGYYLGAKAGRERYNQIRSNIDKVQSSEVFRSVTEKAKEAVGEGVELAKEKAKDVVHRGSNNGHGVTLSGTPGPATAYAPDATP